MKNFIKQSWDEYIAFFKNSIKDKKKRKWILLLIIIVEIGLIIFTIYGGFKVFEYLKEIKWLGF